MTWVIEKPMFRALAVILIQAIACAWLRGESPGAPAELKFSKPTVVGRIEAKELAEASGLARSRTQPGVLWSLTDSGGPPIVFALDAAGKSLAEYRALGALNLDWETLDADGEGMLYVGDTGNNLSVAGVRRMIYVFREPKVPANRDATGPFQGKLDIERAIAYEFPDDPSDVEALIVDKSHGYLIRKDSRKEARVYRLSLAGGDKVSVAKLELVGALQGMSLVTGAELSRDSRRLAVCSNERLAIYTRDQDSAFEDFFRYPPSTVQFPARGTEGCAWLDEKTVLLVDENREMLKIEVEAKGE